MMTNPRSVLLVSNLFAAIPGSWGVCLELATQLRHVGWQVTTTSAWPWRRLRPVDMVWTAWRQRRAYRVAHVDVFSGPAFFWAEWVTAVLRRLRKPVVLTLHGGNLPQFRQKHGGRVRRLLHRAAIVTTPSPYLRAAHAADRSDIRLIPNPIDARAYAGRVRSAVAPRLVWLRAFHTMYNPSLAVSVVHTLRARRPDVTLQMVGRDKGDGALAAARQLAETLGVSDAIAFTGAVPKTDVPRVLDAADIFLNTTNVDNTPISVLEAQATGLCVVSTDVGGLPHLVHHDRDAWLVPPRDPATMSAAVTQLLDNPALARRLSAGAIANAARYDWGAILPQWETTLEEAANYEQPARALP